MATTSNQQNKTHKALSEFVLWFDYGMKSSIHNVLELKKANPAGISNPILTFVVPNAMSYVVERFVLEVYEAWNILNAELKQQGLRVLGTKNKDFLRLKRIRDKLVAHKIENFLRNPEHGIWYKKSYGDFESIFALVLRVAEHIRARIKRLEASGNLGLQSFSAKSVRQFYVEDIEALLNSMKISGIY